MSATRRPFLHWSPARYTVWKVRNAWSASDVQSGKTAIILSAGTGAIRSAKERQTSATSQNLEGMKLIELKELAKQMGLRGTSTMRKPELVATLQAARSGGEAPAGVTVTGKCAASKRPSRRSPLHRPRRLRNRLPRRSPREVHRCQRRMMRWPDCRVSARARCSLDPHAAYLPPEGRRIRQQGRPRRGSSPSHPRRCKGGPGGCRSV